TVRAAPGLESAAADDEAAPRPRRSDPAEGAERQRLGERATEAGRIEGHGLNGVGQSGQRVRVDGRGKARAVVARQGDARETEAGDRQRRGESQQQSYGERGHDASHTAPPWLIAWFADRR